MINRAVEHPIVKFADGVLAFAIVLLCLRPSFFSVLASNSLNAIELSVRDAIAVAIFIFMWQWVFGSLMAYNRFCTIQSRILAVLEGVVLMAVPTSLYVRILHPDWMDSIRPVVSLIVVLFTFEIGRIIVTNLLTEFVASRSPRLAVIVGTGPRACKAWREIRIHYHSSVAVLGFIDDRDMHEMAPEIASLHLGGTKELDRVIKSKAVNLVLIATPLQSCYPIAKRAIEIAESSGVHVAYLGDIFVSGSRASAAGGCIFNELAPKVENPLLHVVVRRFVDVIVSAGLLTILSPLMLAIAATIKLTSRGSILIRKQFYASQQRLFTVYRFRTSAEAAGLPQSENGSRVTVIGRFLRMTSLDALPTLLNVLNGTVSLFGLQSIKVSDMSRFGDRSSAQRFGRRVKEDQILAAQSPEPVVSELIGDLDVRYE